MVKLFAFIFVLPLTIWLLIDPKEGVECEKKGCSMELEGKKCEPCEGGTPPLTAEQVSSYLQQLNTEWEVLENKQIRKTFKFKSFREALDFANKVGEIAEEQQHHPDLHVYYGKVTIDLATHSIGGLSENDFIMASKIEEV